MAESQYLSDCEIDEFLNDLENYVRIIVVVPSLRRVLFYGITGILYHSTTIRLLLVWILIKGVI